MKLQKRNSLRDMKTPTLHFIRVASTLIQSTVCLFLCSLNTRVNNMDQFKMS